MYRSSVAKYLNMFVFFNNYLFLKLISCRIVHITFKKIIGEVILHIFSKYLSSNKIYLIEFFIFLLIIFLYNTKFIRIIL